MISEIGKRATGCTRTYKSIDDEGKEWDICELWNNTKCATL